MNKRGVALLAGTTAGHVYLAAAVAEVLRRRDTQLDILFLGEAVDGPTAYLRRAGYRVEAIPASAYLRVGAGGKVKALANLSRGILAARRILQRDDIAAVVGFGGYASAGGLLAARWLGLPILIHEGNVNPGLANRMLGRFADRIAVSYAATRAFFTTRNVEVTGIPVRAAFAAVGATRVGVHSPAHLLFTGGSYGSAFFNRVGAELATRIRDLGVSIEVRHLTGSADAVAAVRAAYEQAAIPAHVEAATDEMPAALAWADFALCAAGITTAECSNAGLPIYMVPLSWASEDHQRHNAIEFARLTGCGWSTEADWRSEDVAQHIAGLLRDASAWQRAADAMRRGAPTDAAEHVAAMCLSLLPQDRRRM